MEENKSSLIVMEIEPNDKNLRVALGITEERAKALVKIFNLTMAVDQISLSHTLVVCSKECVHANELAWLCFIAGANQNLGKTPSLEGLIKLLGGGR